MAETATTTKTPLRGLSGKLLLLTMAFVMLGEVLIFLPSIANFRLTWLKSRVAQAEIAALAVEAAPTHMLSSDLRSEILKGAGVLVVSLEKQGVRKLVLRGERDEMIDAHYDLRDVGWAGAIADAFGALFAGNGRVIGVTDFPPNMSGDVIDLALEEAPLRAAMIRYGLNILILSVILSLIVAGLIFLALNRALVRPMQRLSRNMVDYGADPEDARRIIAPSDRRDEIGLAERELAAMQTQLSGLLKQKSHLAALGLAVSKVSHDLRNMLTSAHLISDRLARSDDPTVGRFATKLIASLDRAIDFCEQTLKFGRAQEPPPRRSRFNPKELVDEALEAAAPESPAALTLYNNVPQSLTIDADRDQLFRILNNLVRNAVQALEEHGGTITLGARRDGTVAVFEIADTGPGVPDKARKHLFEAFQGSGRPGGTGLGLAIAAELVRAHGGTIELAATGPKGSVFRFTIPDRITELRQDRRGSETA
jgi:signal transduction histidine kinase